MVILILEVLAGIAIPALSAYLASDDTIIKWLISNNFLSSNFDTQSFQRICLIVNIIFTIVLLEGRLVYHKHKEQQGRQEIIGLYNMIKQFAQSNFAAISKNDNFSFDLRIFVPEVSIWGQIKARVQRRKCEKWFVIRNIVPFAKQDITEHLRFMVEPETQGLVGAAYQSGSIVYDDMLTLTNSTKYSLGHSQLSRTSNLRWSICVPILDEKNAVLAVMAFDSDTSDLDIESSRDELNALTNTLAMMMYDSVPELFKRKWRLI